MEAVRSFEKKKGTGPNLLYVFLPCGPHQRTRPGSADPRAMVPDNDLGRGVVKS